MIQAAPSHPVRLMDDLAGLARQRDLLWAWTRRDIESRWQGSFLGIWWALLAPLFMLGLYTVVFSYVLRVQFGTGSFALNLWAGLMPWLAFSETATRAVSAVSGQPNLVKKVVFPLEILPVSLTFAALFNQAIGLGLLLAGAAWTVGLHPNALWLIPLTVTQTAFTLGVAWFLASIGVFVRDLANAIGLVLNAWLYLSPVLYPATMVPPAYHTLYMLNPVAFWVEATRMVVLAHQAPSVAALTIHTLIALGMMVAGFLWFRHTRHAFADIL